MNELLFIRAADTLFRKAVRSYNGYSILHLWISDEKPLPVRLVHLTPWTCGEPRRGLGLCTLYQQFNRPNRTWCISLISIDGRPHSRSKWSWTGLPLEGLSLIPHEKICVLSLSSKPKLGKLSSRGRLWKCCLCLKYVVKRLEHWKYIHNKFERNPELWNKYWASLKDELWLIIEMYCQIK